MTSNVITGPAERGVLQAGIAAGVQGSRQGTYTIYWKKLDGTAMVLTGAVLTGYIQNVEGGDVRAMDGALTVTGAATGVFTWEPGADDVAEAGGFEVQFKAVIGGETAYSYPVPWVVKKNLPAAGLVGGSTLLVGVTQAQANLLDAFLTAAAAATDGQTFIFDGAGSGAEGDAAGGGVSDHGALTGLADDDHTQYHNDTRGDARYTQRSNNLSDVADAATARGNLLAQLASVLLSAIAALTGVANGIIRFTGAAAVEVVVFASHIWTFLESADAAAARTAIGAGTGSGDLLAANNLSDVTASTARTNLAVPGLAVANTFAAAQMVDGSADAIQFRVQGHSTQTNIFQTWEDSSGNVLVGVTKLDTNSGRVNVYVGNAIVGSWYPSGSTVRFQTAGGYDLVFLNHGAELMRGTSLGRLGVGTTSAQGKFHVYDTGGGFMHVYKSGVVGSATTIISDAAGDVTLCLSGTFAVSDGAGNTAGGIITKTAPGGSFDLFTDGGANVCQLQISAGGAVTVIRTAGSRTYAVNLNLNWM